MMLRGVRAARSALPLVGCLAGLACCTPAASAPVGFPCQPVTCSTLLPTASIDDPDTNDCAYRAGNLWWVDAVAGSLAWSDPKPSRPVIVAIFDDGAWIEHEELRNQLWTNEAEANGKAGVDDDGNGYVDDLHGWDFVDDSPDVSPKGACRARFSHGTLMASLVAAQRNNQVGIAAPGSDGARLMILRVIGCNRGVDDQADPTRLVRALDYATRMGARILSFSAHWYATTSALDEAFARIAERDSPHAAIVVASVPNKGEAAAGYPAAYRFRRIVRAIPIGNDAMISPGTSPAPAGLNLGAPSACVIGAGAAPAHYVLQQGSSNSTAILAGLLAGIWAAPAYAKLSTDQFLSTVVQGIMLNTPRRSQRGSRPPYLQGVPLADACLLQTERRSARVCRQSGAPREARP
ncbi:MAG TPA: S8 family serine peptidase [Steroidobacteraceae bacterium]